MIARRVFLGAAATGLAAPFILRSAARAANPRVRRDVMELADNDPFFIKYGDAVAAMHKLPDSDGRNWIRQARSTPISASIHNLRSCIGIGTTSTSSRRSAAR
jgi:hypothetical protein